MIRVIGRLTKAIRFAAGKFRDIHQIINFFTCVSEPKSRKWCHVLNSDQEVIFTIEN